MKTLADRFRRWYDYECDCNAKTLTMLSSVPPDKRAEPEFEKALGRMAHLVAGRRRWLCRLGHWPDEPALFPKTATLVELTGLVAETESAWCRYLEKLDEGELTREFEWRAADDKRYRWNVEGVLTQMFGHAWYHRGQIVQLVAALGGSVADTDYVFWCKPPVVDSPAAG